MTLVPDPSQQRVLDDVRRWLASPRNRRDPKDQLRYLTGVAGSGKTSIARLAVEGFRARFAAPTGKAALVLRSKGCEGATTLHSLIYRPEEATEVGADGITRRVVRYTRNTSNEDGGRFADIDVVVADECSMVGDKLAADLLAFGVRVLLLGDPFQLPPVEGTSAFATARPDWMLDQVHRQAADSGVLRLATAIRLGQHIDPRPGAYGSDVTIASRHNIDPGDIFIHHDQVLVGTHNSRRGLNQWIRSAVGVTQMLPVTGDKVVCRRNNAEKGLINGSQWNVLAASNGGPRMPWTCLTLESSDALEAGVVQVTSHPHHFIGTYEGGDAVDALKRLPWSSAKAHEEFDYAYAMTVHSSQGSQWSSVAVLDESYCFRQDAPRHLYTAVTRAADRVTVLV